MRWGCQRNNQRSPKTLLFAFRRFACRPAAFLSVWGGQREREASLFNLKFLAARVRVYVRQLTGGRVFAAVCGQPVFEVGVVGADEDGGVFLVKMSVRSIQRKTTAAKVSQGICSIWLWKIGKPRESLRFIWLPTIPLFMKDTVGSSCAWYRETAKTI